MVSNPHGRGGQVAQAAREHRPQAVRLLERIATGETPADAVAVHKAALAVLADPRRHPKEVQLQAVERLGSIVTHADPLSQVLTATALVQLASGRRPEL